MRMKNTKVVNNRSKCFWCGGCVAVCPEDAIVLEERIITVSNECTGCGICLRFCPVGAMEEENEV
jgi:Fe-S-cluster-containing hydrogenase component 2